MGDLNSRRGRIAGMDTRGAPPIIRAGADVGDAHYEQNLTSTTGGRGAYHMEFSHYEEVPGHCTRSHRRVEGRAWSGGG